MSVIFVLLPLALLFAAAALGVFIWAALSGQYDDVHTPAVRILHDDEPLGSGAGEAGTERNPKAV